MTTQGSITLDRRQLNEAQILFQAVLHHPGIDDALKRILDDGYRILVDAEIERAAAAASLSTPGGGGNPAVSALLPFETPLRMARGAGLRYFCRDLGGARRRSTRRRR